MPRNFATRFHRQMTNGFAGDAAPAGALVLNDPATFAGVIFRMSPVRIDDQKRPTNRLEGYFLSNVGGLTLTLQLWISSGLGTDAAATWVQVGTAIAAVPQNREFFLIGTIADADAVVQVTPSAPLGVGQTIDLFMEEAEV